MYPTVNTYSKDETNKLRVLKCCDSLTKFQFNLATVVQQSICVFTPVINWEIFMEKVCRKD